MKLKKLIGVTLVSIVILFSLLVSTVSAKGIYPQSIKRVASIGDKHAVDRVESFLWGYGYAAHNHGCIAVDDYHFRREAEKAWLDIKYMNNQDANFINATAVWFTENYKCSHKQK